MECSEVRRLDLISSEDDSLYISSQRRVMNRIEWVIVANGQIGVWVEEEFDQIVTFLRNCIVNRGVALRVTQAWMGATLEKNSNHVGMSFVHGDMERRLETFIPRIQVTIQIG